jgi:hypothetical protein
MGNELNFLVELIELRKADRKVNLAIHKKIDSQRLMICIFKTA